MTYTVGWGVKLCLLIHSLGKWGCKLEL